MWILRANSPTIKEMKRNLLEIIIKKVDAINTIENH